MTSDTTKLEGSIFRITWCKQTLSLLAKPWHSGTIVIHTHTKTATATDITTPPPNHTHSTMTHTTCTHAHMHTCMFTIWYYPRMPIITASNTSFLITSTIIRVGVTSCTSRPSHRQQLAYPKNLSDDSSIRQQRRSSMKRIHLIQESVMVLPWKQKWRTIEEKNTYHSRKSMLLVLS